jgi:diphthamide synthase subunit DPH2
MNKKELLKRQQRLREIEDRKIEILLEVPSVKDNNEKISELNDEYEQLGDEYYYIKLELIREKQKA